MRGNSWQCHADGTADGILTLAEPRTGSLGPPDEPFSLLEKLSPFVKHSQSTLSVALKKHL